MIRKVSEEHIHCAQLLTEASLPVVLGLCPKRPTSRAIDAPRALLRGSFCGALQVARDLGFGKRCNLHGLTHPLRRQALKGMLVSCACMF